ncbi:hypothetical protein WJX74_005043 [Apatococcus lobatus]|uniref:Uncharacterized protein n=1 Tax=Apatococcus lobatus TaxID=904363 RepID=A0AAW1QZZ7_9CHLO
MAPSKQVPPNTFRSYVRELEHEGLGAVSEACGSKAADDVGESLRRTTAAAICGGHAGALHTVSAGCSKHAQVWRAGPAGLPGTWWCWLELAKARALGCRGARSWHGLHVALHFPGCRAHLQSLEVYEGLKIHD